MDRKCTAFCATSWNGFDYVRLLHVPEPCTETHFPIRYEVAAKCQLHQLRFRRTVAQDQAAADAFELQH